MSPGAVWSCALQEAISNKKPAPHWERAGFGKLTQDSGDSAPSSPAHARAAPGIRAIGIAVELSGLLVHDGSVTVCNVSVGKLDGPFRTVKNSEVKISSRG